MTLLIRAALVAVGREEGTAGESGKLAAAKGVMGVIDGEREVATSGTGDREK